MDKQTKKAFKKLTNLFFFPVPETIHFGWRAENGIPVDKIFYGIMGAPRPTMVFSPYDIERLTYTRPGFFKLGELNVIGTDGNIKLSLSFKDKENMKIADRFNECLVLYKQYGLGK